MTSSTNKTAYSRETPWGVWATGGWGLLVAVFFIILQGSVLAGFVAREIARNPHADIFAAAEGLEANGFVMALATLVTTPLCLGLISLLVRLRKGLTIVRYLGLKAISPRTMLLWLGIVTLFALFVELLAHLAGWPFMPDFMVDAYTTAYFPRSSGSPSSLPRPCLRSFSSGDFSSRDFNTRDSVLWALYV